MSEGTVLAEQAYRPEAPAAGKSTKGPWAALALVMVAAAFAAGWRSRREWGRLMGY